MKSSNCSVQLVVRNKYVDGGALLEKGLENSRKTRMKLIACSTVKHRHHNKRHRQRSFAEKGRNPLTQLQALATKCLRTFFDLSPLKLETHVDGHLRDLRDQKKRKIVCATNFPYTMANFKNIFIAFSRFFSIHLEIC